MKDISSLDLSVRLLNVLHFMNINTTEDLKTKSFKDFSECRYMTKKMLRETTELYRDLGMDFRP